MCAIYDYCFLWWTHLYLYLYLYKYIYIYIFKSWSVTFIVATLQLSHISSTSLSFFFLIFLQLFLTFIFQIFTLPQHFSYPYLFIFPLLLQPFSLPYLFISSLSSTLISFFLFSFIFLYFCLFLFTPSYYKFATNFSILYMVFPHKKRLSLSLSLNFLVDLFYFSCIYFRLIIFYII